MIADHCEDDRNHDEGVMLRAGFGACALGEIRRLASPERGDHAALRGQDAHPDVCRHDRAEHRPELHVGGAPGEVFAANPGSEHDQRIRNSHAERVAFAEFPEQIVELFTETVGLAVTFTFTVLVAIVAHPVKLPLTV